MTAKLLFIGSIIFLLGILIGTGQTLVIQNLSTIEGHFQPTPTPSARVLPTATPTLAPTATPSATPTPVIIRRIRPVTKTPTPSV